MKYAGYLLALTDDAAKTAAKMQHTSPVMLYRHYKGVASQADAQAWFAIVPPMKRRTSQKFLSDDRRGLVCRSCIKPFPDAIVRRPHLHTGRNANRNEAVFLASHL